MSKITLGLIVGAVLGAVDGLSAYLYPLFGDPVRYASVKDGIVGIVLGSTFKGLLTGLAAGWVATRTRSLPIGVGVGVVVGFALSYAVAAMPSPEGYHYYMEIVLPGMLVGAIVGYCTQRFGRPARSSSASPATPPAKPVNR